MAIEVTLTRCHLRDLREAAGYTKVQLADIVGTYKQRIDEHEKKVVNMHLDTALKYCAALNCTLDELFEYEVRRK